jgi:SOUL heme-binding protein
VTVIASFKTVIGQLIEAAGSVVGYRGGTAEPDHSIEKLTDGVEIRRYGVRIAAETTVNADEESARNTGFRRLARYIFGGNHTKAKIAMTAPVEQQPGAHAKIAMTAPVSQEAAGENEWVIRFFMPAGKTLQSLPEPDDAEVRLVTVPPQTVAVRRFAGSRSSRSVAAETAKLMDTLRDDGFQATDTPAAWFYDPPWTLPALRRNEVAVPVKRARGCAS